MRCYYGAWCNQFDIIQEPNDKLTYLNIRLNLNPSFQQSWVGLCHEIVHVLSPSVRILRQVIRYLSRFYIFRDEVLSRFRWSPSLNIWNLLVHRSVRFVYPNHLSHFILNNDAFFLMLTLSVKRKSGIQCIIARLFLFIFNKLSFLTA